MSPSSSSSTEANLETARAAVDAFNGRDVDAMMALGHDDFVYDWSRSMAPNRGIYRAPQGFIEFARRAVGHVQRDPDRAPGREDILVSANSAMLYTFEAGRLVRITLYQGGDEALAATH